jgi:phage terminase large subunit-like protein
MKKPTYCLPRSRSSPKYHDRNLAVWVGLDASTKHDSTAIVACAWDEEAKSVRLIWHKIFQPSPQNRLDFEATIERELLERDNRFEVKEVKFAPWQMVRTSQQLRNAGLPMEECSQTPPNQTEWTNNLEELIRSRGLAVYSDVTFERLYRTASWSRVRVGSGSRRSDKPTRLTW